MKPLSHARSLRLLKFAEFAKFRIIGLGVKTKD